MDAGDRPLRGQYLLYLNIAPSQPQQLLLNRVATLFHGGPPMTRNDVSSNVAIEECYEEYVMPIWKSLNDPIQWAADSTLEDFDGNEYLDLFSGISVTNDGHGNDAVVDAGEPPEILFLQLRNGGSRRRDQNTLNAVFSEVTTDD